MKTYFGLLIFCLLFFGCSENSVEPISTIELNGVEVNCFELQHVRDTIDLKLSELVQDIEFVALETRPECLLGSSRFYVDQRQIIAFDRKAGVFQFERSGRFVKQIAYAGKGPLELSSYSWAIDKRGSKLYVKDRYHDYIICFDLESGKHMKNIPLALGCTVVQMIIDASNNICIVPVLSKSNKEARFYMFKQNEEGELLGGIPAPVDLKHNIGNSVLFQEKHKLSYYKSESDTLYLVQEYERVPNWIFDLGIELEKEEYMPGSKNMRIIVNQEYFMLNSLFIAETVKRNGNNTTIDGEVYYLFIDKKKKRASYISELIVDDLGRAIRPVFLRSQSNGTAFIKYDSYRLKELIFEFLKKPEVSKENIEKLRTLNNQIEEEDNPVLLIGRFK